MQAERNAWRSAALGRFAGTARRCLFLRSALYCVSDPPDPYVVSPADPSRFSEQSRGQLDVGGDGGGASAEAGFLEGEVELRLDAAQVGVDLGQGGLAMLDVVEALAQQADRGLFEARTAVDGAAASSRS